MTTRQLMLLVVFAAFAFLGPLPLVRPVMQTYGMRISTGQRPDLIAMLVIFGVIMGCLSSLVPTLLFLRGTFRLWIFRLLLALAALVMAGTFATMSVRMLSSRTPMTTSQYIRRLFTTSFGLFDLAIMIASTTALVVILLYFWRRIIPRTCPVCERRRMILLRSDRVRDEVPAGGHSLSKSGRAEIGTLEPAATHKRRQWACLSCGAEDTQVEGPSVTDLSEEAAIGLP